MKRMKILLMTAGVLVLQMLWLAGCADQKYNEPKRETQAVNGTHAANGTLAELQKQQHEFENEMQAKVAELNRRLGKMEGRAETLRGQTQETLNEQIDELEKQLDDAKNKLNNLSDATAENWENTKSQVKAAFQDVEGAFDRATERFAQALK